MIVIHLDQVTVTYIQKPVFSDLSWEIHNDRVIGLVGPNGSGKSTLLRLIQGLVPTDTGILKHQKNLKIAYLPQEPELNQAHTVWQEVMASHLELAQIESQLKQVEEKLADPDVYLDQLKLTGVLNRQERLLEKFEALGGANFEGRVRSILTDFGFSEESFNLSVTVLSGGQKKLVGMAKLLITQPDLLLLDEPDNHLDLEGKTFLEKFIRNFKGGVIIVSHDRYLLDMVVDEIAEMEAGRLTLFPGNYSEYAYEKQLRLARQEVMYRVQQNEISRLEESAKRLLTWGQVYDNEKLVKRGKAILKRIDRIDRIEKPITEKRQMGLELTGWRGSNKVLDIQDLHKTFTDTLSEDQEPILNGVDLQLWHGERVGLVGPNGAGKSVLFRIIREEEPLTEGSVNLGPSVEIGFYSQEHEILDPERTLIDTISFYKGCSESTAVALLGRFVFTYEQARSKVKTLSGGEKSRLQMALLMLSGANFLLLDEPTNNLDIDSAEVLENAIEEFEGTVLVISHDRYFLDRVVKRIVELEDGELSEYSGNFSNYQQEKLKRK